MTDLWNFIQNDWYLILAAVVAFFYVMAGFTTVAEWERVPVLRFGKYLTTLEPGIVWFEPITCNVLDAIDIRQNVKTFAMDEGASLQTLDNVPISFVTVLTTQIDPSNIRKYLMAVNSGATSLNQRALSAVSEIVSKYELNALLHSRDKVAADIQALLRQRVLEWGVYVVAVELRNVMITDVSIQEAIALKARASKEADAELVRAEAQIKISRELTTAAAALSPDGWRLKGMEVLTEMTRSGENNTIVIPSEIVGLLSAFSPSKR